RCAERDPPAGAPCAREATPPAREESARRERLLDRDERGPLRGTRPARRGAVCPRGDAARP
ncbi:hypothetical protein ACWDAO_13610, partial [Streptomyces sp. NPDC001212]